MPAIAGIPYFYRRFGYEMTAWKHRNTHNTFG